MLQVPKHNVGATALVLTNIQIADGETKILIDSDGCGKPTSLRLIASINQPVTGNICFKGKPFSTDNIIHIRQRRGFIIQEDGLFPPLNGHL
jgi:ABC-type proline/glycine betaine transport system ATPase subunit